MIASMINGDPDPEDLRKFFQALKRAQHHIDLRPELYTHYYKKEFPVRYHDRMDTRRWGPGERVYLSRTRRRTSTTRGSGWSSMTSFPTVISVLVTTRNRWSGSRRNSSNARSLHQRLLG